MHGRKFRAVLEDVDQGVDANSATGVCETCLHGAQGVAVIVDLRQVVEHDQAIRRETGEDQLDGVVEVADARRDDRRLGLGDDRAQLGDRCARLQRHGNRAQSDQCDVDGRVVDAGEAHQCDAVAGPDRVVGQCIGDRLNPLGDVGVGDGLEAGEKRGSGPAGVGIGDEFDGSRPEGGPVRVAVEDGPDDLRKSETGLLDGGGNRHVGRGVGELQVRSFQVCDAALEVLLAGNSRHQKSSVIAGKVARRCAYMKLR